MPEQPANKIKPAAIHHHRRSTSPIAYAELHVTSNFSFLRGASHPEELVATAAALGYRAIALTDNASMAGMVRAHVAAKAAHIPLIPGCRMDLADCQTTLLLYPVDRAAWGRLCRLITLGRSRAHEKATSIIHLADLQQYQHNLLSVVIAPPASTASFPKVLRQLRDIFDDDRLSLAVTPQYGHDDAGHAAEIWALSQHVDVPIVAVNNVLYHHPQRRVLQDVLTGIRCRCTLDQLGLRRAAHAQRYLKTPEQMARLFAWYPQALGRTLDIAGRVAGFSLDQLVYQYPHEIHPAGQSAMDYLINLTWQGAARRYSHAIPAAIRLRLEHEFNLIRELKYPAYFLTVYDIVQFARSRGILCQGRGAAANSAVCYCLGITAVDPTRIDLLMECFISKQRDEPPDIDIDFEHQRREEVIQYIYRRFGRHRAALTAEVITYRPRSALRDVGKVLGLSQSCVDQLAKSTDWWDPAVGDRRKLRASGLNPEDPTMGLLHRLASDILGFPRHLSQHVGGFVITEDPLCELVPIANAAMPDRTIIEWDKDDLDAMGMLKIDVLALGMLTCIRKAIDLVNQSAASSLPSTAPGPPLEFHTIPAEVPAVYDMLCRADSLGVFQVESRAQMAMLPRLKPRCYYDLVIEVAIIRPGPIQGGMVHPYLRRRQGDEPVSYPSLAVRQVLERTLGVPLFQEQVMRLAMVAAGFSASQADALRRSMAAWKRRSGQLQSLADPFMQGLLANGYTPEFARQCFAQIQGFGEYGFPESHAASFALLVYVSAWLKCMHPAAFAAALLNSQPMGFYQPAQIVRDACAHGVMVLPVDVNFSHWDCTLEARPIRQPDIPEKPAPSAPAAPPNHPLALRLGFRMIYSIHRRAARSIVHTRDRNGPFTTLRDVLTVPEVQLADLRRLAQADAFTSLGLTRQQALWKIGAMDDAPLPLLDSPAAAPWADSSAASALPPMDPPQQVVVDYRHMGLSLKNHPLFFIRSRLTEMGILPLSALTDPVLSPHAITVGVAGLVLVRQRPQTAAGILFVTLEDETGVANLIIRPNIYRRFRNAIRSSVGLMAWGTLQRQDQVVHVLVTRAQDMAACQPSAAGADIPGNSRDFH